MSLFNDIYLMPVTVLYTHWLIPLKGLGEGTTFLQAQMRKKGG
jgi:hypothetical protein